MTTEFKPATAPAYLVTDVYGHRTKFSRIADPNDPPICDWCSGVSSDPRPATYRGQDAPLDGMDPDPAVSPMNLCDVCMGDLIGWTDGKVEVLE
jgi:hypothetical protein